MEPVTKLREIKLDDPLREQKISLINGINRLSDLMTSIRRDQENLLLVIGTFFFGTFLSFYLNSIIFYLIFGIVLLLFLILATIKNKKDFNSLFNQHEKIVERANKIGLDLRQKF